MADCSCLRCQLADCIDRARPLVDQWLGEGRALDELVAVFVAVPEGIEIRVMQLVHIGQVVPELERWLDQSEAVERLARTIAVVAPGRVPWFGLVGSSLLAGDFRVAPSSPVEA